MTRRAYKPTFLTSCDGLLRGTIEHFVVEKRSCPAGGRNFEVRKRLILSDVLSECYDLIGSDGQRHVPSRQSTWPEQNPPAGFRTLTGVIEAEPLRDFAPFSDRGGMLGDG